MRAASWVFGDHRRLEAAQKAATIGGRLLGDRTIRSVPGLGAWTQARDAPTPPTETFRQWWARTHTSEDAAAAPDPHGGGLAPSPEPRVARESGEESR